MLSQNFKIVSIFNKSAPVFHNNKIYTLFNDTLYSTDINTLECIPIVPENISNFTIIDDYLYYFNTEVYKYEINTKLTDKINSKNNFIIKTLLKYKTDIIFVYDNNEIIYKERIIYKDYFKFYLVEGDFLYIADDTNIYKIDLITYTSSIVFTGNEIISLCFNEEEIIIFCKNSIYRSNGIFNIKIDDVQISKTCFFIQFDGKTTVYDYNLQIKSKYDNLRYINDKIMYDEDFTIYINEKTIFGNLGDVLDVVEIDNNIVFSTGNKLVICSTENFYIKNDESENNDETSSRSFACSGQVKIDHSDTILSISSNSMFLITTSRDELSTLYLISENFLFVRQYKSGVMNSSFIFDKMCVMGGDDGLICLISDLEKEEIVVQKICEKDINSVFIHKDLIFVASADKTCQILNFDLEIVKTISDHKKSVMSVHASSMYFCTASSDKTIRVYNYNFDCISVLSGHDTGVLCARLFNKDKNVVSCGVGGLIKIFSSKKGICTDNLVINNDIWSIETKYINSDSSYLLFGTSNKIVSYKNYKDMVTKNNQIHLKNREYDKVITKNNKLIYFMLKETDNRPFLYKKYKNRLFSIIQECGRSKDIEFIMDILDFCIDNKIFSKEAINNLKKYLVVSDELYGDLVAAEIFFK